MHEIGVCRLFQKLMKITLSFKPHSLGIQEQLHKNDKFLDNYFQLYDGILIPIGWLKRYVTLFSTF